MGRNPATGEAIEIPAKSVVKMRWQKRLRRRLCQGRNRVGLLANYETRGK